MKNVQIISPAVNYPQTVFGVAEEDFQLVFPEGRDMAFEREVSQRLKSKGIDLQIILNRIRKKPLDKKQITGIHGTLYTSDSWIEPSYFPNFLESDWETHSPKSPQSPPKKPKS